MAKWNLLGIDELKELHLNTNTLSEEQSKMLAKHNALVDFAFLIRSWIDNTPTVNNSEYRGFKNHFVGKTASQWSGVCQLGKDLRELEKLEILLEIQSKYEIGLNMLHLIKCSLKEIGDLSTFFCNKRKLRKKLIKAHRSHLLLKDAVSKIINETPHHSSGEIDFFRKTEMLIGSAELNYLKAIVDQGEHNQRRIIDAFF